MIFKILAIYENDFISVITILPDGKTLNGWTKQGNANWSVNAGVITADTGEICLLTTNKKYDNYELELEFKAAIGTNSGIFLKTDSLQVAS